MPLTKPFLTTAFDRAFTRNGFGNFFRDRCNQPGLPQCSVHGLRSKATARLLAEAGCTAHEIAAITRHASLKEVARCAIAVDQAGLAASAMNKTERQFVGLSPPTIRAKNDAGSIAEVWDGAQGRNRTTDTVIFSHVLYQLSYLGGREARTRASQSGAVIGA